MSARGLAVAVCSMPYNKERFSDFLLQVKQFQHVKFTYICIQNHLRNPDPASFIDYDAAILLHPISMGRLSITDVKDARYDVFLPFLRDTFGRDRVAVLISECTFFGEESIRSSQPTAFECSAHFQLCSQFTDSEVMSLIASFVSHVPSVPKPDPKHVLAKYQLDKQPKAGGTAAAINMEVGSLTVQMAPFNDRGLTQDRDDIDFIVWANTRTRDVLLETLCSQDLVAFTAFEQIADGWRRVHAVSPYQVDQSQAFQKCAVFIYRDNIPTNLTYGHVEELRKALKGMEEATPVTIKGRGNSIFYDQFLQLAKEASPGMVLIVYDARKANLTKSAAAVTWSKGSILKLHDTVKQDFEEEMAKKSEIRDLERKLKIHGQEKKRLEKDMEELKKEITYLQNVKLREEQKRQNDRIIEECTQNERERLKRECESEIKNLRDEMTLLHEKSKQEKEKWKIEQEANEDREIKRKRDEEEYVKQTKEREDEITSWENKKAEEREKWTNEMAKGETMKLKLERKKREYESEIFRLSHELHILRGKSIKAKEEVEKKYKDQEDLQKKRKRQSEEELRKLKEEIVKATETIEKMQNDQKDASITQLLHTEDVVESEINEQNNNLLDVAIQCNTDTTDIKIGLHELRESIKNVQTKWKMEKKQIQDYHKKLDDNMEVYIETVQDIYTTLEEMEQGICMMQIFPRDKRKMGQASRTATSKGYAIS